MRQAMKRTGEAAVQGITFTVLGTPKPQGSMRAITGRNGKAFLKSDNEAMRPWRQEVGWTALRARSEAGYNDVFAGRHVPVRVRYVFTFRPPGTMPKGRVLPAVKPDMDKLCRAIGDALKGVLYEDDGQIVESSERKVYGPVAMAEITVEILA